MSRRRRGRVLILVADPAVRGLLSRYFESREYYVEAAADRETGASRLAREDFDLVLAEVPGSETDSVAQLLERHRNRRWILLPDSDHSSVLQRLWRLHPWDVLPPPVTFADLDAILRKSTPSVSFETLIREAEHWNRRVEIRFPSDIRLVPEVLREVDRLCEGVPAEPGIRDVKIPLIVAEAVYNAVEHGNRSDPRKYVMLEARAEKDGLTVVIEDEGEGFAVPNLERLPEEQSEGGRGLFLMRLYASEVRFEKGGRRVFLRRSWV